MILFIYVFICLAWSGIVVSGNNNRHFLQAFGMSLLLTPFFSKWAYYALYDFEADKTKQDKEYKRFSKNIERPRIEAYKKKRLMELETNVLKEWSKKKFPESKI